MNRYWTYVPTLVNQAAFELPSAIAGHSMIYLHDYKVSSDFPCNKTGNIHQCSLNQEFLVADNRSRHSIECRARRQPVRISSETVAARTQ